MEPLNGFDATWLYLETDETPMHVGAFQLFRLPERLESGGFASAITAQIGARLHLVPAFRRRLSFTPLNLDHPVWIEDGGFELKNHIVTHQLPAGAGLADAVRLVEAEHAKPLSHAKPLWEVHVIEGLKSGEAALYVKLHHAVTDNDGGQSTMRILCDISPHPEPMVAGVDDWEGEADPGFLKSVSRVAWTMLDAPGRTARALPSIARAALRMGKVAVTRTEQFAELMGPVSPFNAPLTPERSMALFDVPFETIKDLAVRGEAGVTDIVLAAAGGAVRAYLMKRDALPHRAMTALTPYSTRDPDDGAVEDRLSVILASLATDRSGPLARLEAIKASVESGRMAFEQDEGAPFAPYSVLGAPAILRGLVGAYGRLELAGKHRPMLGNLVVSNVVGVSRPLYVAGAEMVANWPLAWLLPGQALNIAAQSYRDRLYVTVLGCPAAVEAPDELAALFRVELAILDEALPKAKDLKHKAVA